MLRKISFYLQQLIVVLLPFFVIRKGTSSFYLYLKISFIVIILTLIFEKKKINYKGKLLLLLGSLFSLLYLASLFRNGLYEEFDYFFFRFFISYLSFFLFSQLYISKKTFIPLATSALISIWMPITSALLEWKSRGFSIYRAAGNYRLTGDWEIVLFSCYMGIFTLITLYLLLQDIKFRYKVPIFITNLFCMLLLILSQSRMAWIATFIGVVFVIIVSSKKKVLHYGLVILALFAMSTPFLLKTDIYKSTKTKLATLTNLKGDLSASSRIYTWEESIRQIIENPIFGNGSYSQTSMKKHQEYLKYSNLKKDDFDKLPADIQVKFHAYIEALHAHNSILDITVVAGSIATILFLAILFFIFDLLFRDFSNNKDIHYNLTPYLCFIYIIYLGYNISDVAYTFERLTIAFWIILGMHFALNNEKAMGEN